MRSSARSRDVHTRSVAAEVSEVVADAGERGNGVEGVESRGNDASTEPVEYKVYQPQPVHIL